MKKWVKFFFCSFFSHKTAKEGARRGYSNAFLGFALALVFLFSGFVGAEMLPFGIHYGNSPDFKSTVRAVFANADEEKRIFAEIENGKIKVKKHGGEFAEGVLVNTFENDGDKRDYSVNGYNVVIDTRPATTLAEIEAYCVSNDGKNTVITYEEYLSLSEVARLNFDFRLRYTGNSFEPDEAAVAAYREYLDGLSVENKGKTEKLAGELAEGKITRAEYDRAIYEIYFTSYYPEITAYESTSKVPLLRNYYYHQYVSQGTDAYLFVFDDCLTGSFETSGGVDVQFYGFYSDMQNGAPVSHGMAQAKTNEAADSFIKSSFKANWVLNVYAHVVNVISLVPFIALMLMVATLLAYSVLKLRGNESIASLGAMLKIIGSFVWTSGAVSAVFAVITAFFVKRGIINALSLVLFFIVLIVRSIIFVVTENRLYTKQSEQQIQTEV